MKKIKFVFIGIIIFIALVFCFYGLFFDNSILSSKYSDIENLSKRNIGAVVYNMTSSPVKITDYKAVKIIPPHKSSKQAGVFDADSIIIDKPMYYKNVAYKSDVFKFCDYASIKIIEKKNRTELISSACSNLCKLVDDFDFYPSITEAFN